MDLIFLHPATYALSATVLPVVRRVKTPVVVLNLAPGTSIEYQSFNRMGDRGKMTAEWLAWCQSCVVPEITNLFQKAGVPFFQITGMLDSDPIVWREVERVPSLVEG